MNAKILGVLGGSGGDVYRAAHDDGTLAAYCWDEFELREVKQWTPPTMSFSFDPEIVLPKR